MNIAVLMGRLTANPELKQTPSGVNVCSFTIAVDRNAKKGEERQADFLNIVAWRANAEFVSKWFKKGDPIIVEGSIQTRNYENKEGKKVYITEIVANRFNFVLRSNGNGMTTDMAGSAPMGEPADQTPSYSNANPGDFAELQGEDDLPF